MRLEEPPTLLGRWSLERTIEDRLTGQLTRVDGTVDLSADAPGSADRLCWQERGTWRRPGGDCEVARTLRLELADDGWWVRFADGRDFHPWRPGEQVVHLCGADVYTGLVSGTPRRWTVEWRARGPGKDYTASSVLRP